MVKANLLFLVGITSAFLLTVQLIALQYLIHQVCCRLGNIFKVSYHIFIFRGQLKNLLNG